MLFSVAKKIKYVVFYGPRFSGSFHDQGIPRADETAQRERNSGGKRSGGSKGKTAAGPVCPTKETIDGTAGCHCWNTTASDGQESLLQISSWTKEDHSH